MEPVSLFDLAAKQAQWLSVRQSAIAGKIANAKDWTFKRTLVDTLDGKAPEVSDSSGVVGLEPRPAA